jgi:catechol 2,3-dioxygenase-like lactoylglutathione lyase family enzyme
MSVQVYGCNHIAIEVDDVAKAVAFYRDVFNLEKLDEGEGEAFFKLGEHQFLAIFGVEKVPPFRCDFRDPFGNRIQVGDLHDESLVWLLPYREVQKAGVRLGEPGAAAVD